MFNPFQLLFPRKFLGIDIGTSYIKLVEISKFGYRTKLESYGSLSASILYEKSFRTFEKSTLLLNSRDISRAILAIIEEAGMKAKLAIFSIPDFSTFFTNIELPPMTKEELPEAVRFEARQHIPLPLNEVTLDWQIIDGKPSNQKKNSPAKLKVLLAAVPNEVINQYREIARIAQLELFALEAEVFGLIRSLSEEDGLGPYAIIDIGAQSTTCNIVDKKILQISHSFDMGGNEFTKVLSKGLNIDERKANELEKKYGLLPSVSGEGQDVRGVLLSLVDVIIGEAERIFSSFTAKQEKEIQKILLAGGLAFLPGLKEYFAEKLAKETDIANPFKNIFYPPILEKTLKEMGPSFAIATGMALRGLEY
ncbi:MAG: type IV pilus assembly protein PilM [bacterium]|nr:type IV pilus assembly protein PilM [bacterium]